MAALRDQQSDNVADVAFPEWIECGFDIFNPFRPEVMDVCEIKRMYGNDLTCYSGISIQRTLPCGAVSQVKDEVRRRVDTVGKQGGYVASPSHDIPGDARPENVAATIDVLQNR